MKDYQERIKEHYSTLSPGQKKVGKYILDNPQVIATVSASQLGDKIGVSETTVIRFCYAIEYSGYSELQNEVRNQLIFQKSSLHEYQASKVGIANEPNFFSQSMKRDQANIDIMINQINEEDLRKATNLIFNANNVLVSGIRTSFSAAHWLSFTLNIIRGNSRLVHPGIDDVNHLLAGLDNNSVLIGITFHRYSSITLGLAKSAKEKGAKVIAVTDSLVSPIAEYSDIILPISLPTKSTIDTAPAVFSLINAIVAGVSVIDKEGFEKRREEYEKYNPGYFFM